MDNWHRIPCPNRIDKKTKNGGLREYCDHTLFYIEENPAPKRELHPCKYCSALIEVIIDENGNCLMDVIGRQRVEAPDYPYIAKGSYKKWQQAQN